MGLSAMAGPIVAGGLINLNVFGTGWRMIFLVNVPVSIFALIAGAKFLPPRSRRNPGPPRPGRRLVGRRRHVPGGLPPGPGPPTWLAAVAGPLLVASVPVMGLFAAHQIHRKRSGVAPLVEPSIFTRSAYVSGLVFSLAFIGSMGAIVLIFNVLLQVRAGVFGMAFGVDDGTMGGRGIHRFGDERHDDGSVGSTCPPRRPGDRGCRSGGGLRGAARCGRRGAHAPTCWHPWLSEDWGWEWSSCPLFDIVMAGVRPHEMGSASGVLQATNGLAMSIGVGGLGALFFGLVGSKAVHRSDFVHAAEWTSLLTVVLLAAAFAIAFKLPHHPVQLSPSEYGSDDDPAALDAIETGLDGYFFEDRELVH